MIEALICAQKIPVYWQNSSQKRKIYILAESSLRLASRLRDWQMLSYALVAAQSRLPFVVLMQACLLYGFQLTEVA